MHQSDGSRARHRVLRRLAPAAVVVAALVAAVPGQAASPCRTVTLGGHANGHTITVPRCGRLIIRLQESFDGGYLWQVSRTPAPAVLRLVSSRAVYPKHRPGVVGGYDTRILTYRATGAGRTTLKLSEVRGSDTAHPAARYRLTVRVS